jgi:hypothetical protein
MFAAAFAAISAACAMWVAIRTGRWRETDEAKALIKRVGDVEGRVRDCEIRMEDLPTRADLERLRGEVHAVRDGVQNANNGIDRIEAFFLARGVERTS